MFSDAQGLVGLLVSVAAFIGAVWGLVSAATASTSAFPAAGKQTKTLWVVLLAASAVIAFAALPYPFGRGGGPFGFLGLITLVIVIVYFVSVRPAIAPFRKARGGSGPRNTGGW